MYKNYYKLNYYLINSGLENAGTDILYTYFNLKTGELEKTSSVKDPLVSIFPWMCYDHKNNVAWGVSDNKKTFEKVCCFSNYSIPEKFMYIEGSDLYEPFENQKIMELAFEGLGIYSDEQNAG